MNIEVEIKVKVDDLGPVKEKLLNLGKIRKSIKQIDEYYVPCHRDFFAQEPSPNEWLRIRTNPDKVIFEYDRSVNKEDGSQDYAQEYETEISEPDVFRKILEFLDFKKMAVVDKEREYWDCDGFEVCLDKVKDLGSFIEVEAKGDFSSTEQARQECGCFLEKLGLKNWRENQIKTGYPVLLLKLKKV